MEQYFKYLPRFDVYEIRQVQWEGETTGRGYWAVEIGPHTWTAAPDGEAKPNVGDLLVCEEYNTFIAHKWLIRRWERGT